MSQVRRVEIQQLPDSIEVFVALRNDLAHTPCGGAAMMVVALEAYTRDEELGRQCLTVAVDRSRLVEGTKGWKSVQLGKREFDLLRRQLETHPHLPRTYFVGTDVTEGYRLLDFPLVVECSDNVYSGDVDAGSYKVFVACSGADSPRPVTLQINQKGIWKASEWSSLLSGVRAPGKPVIDDL